MPRQIETTVGGVTYPSFQAACKAHGVEWSAAKWRIRQGHSIERAMSMKSVRHRNRAPVEINGIRFHNVSQACRWYGIAPNTAFDRIYKGWSLKRAVLTPPQKPPVTPQGRLCACPGCTRELKRNRHENSVAWRERKYCSLSCSKRSESTRPSESDVARLRVFVDAFTYRKSTRLLGVCDKTIRRALQGAPVRHEILEKIRKVLDEADETPA
jgi:hypothetical protein